MKTKTQTNDHRAVRHIPILTLDKLKTLDYKRKDDLYCILHLIYSKLNRFKSNLEKKYLYVPISRMAFKKIIGKNENVMKAIKFLLDNDIIDRDSRYTAVGKRCMGYRIKANLLGGFRRVRINDKNINKRLTKNKIEAKKVRNHNQRFQQSEYFSKFNLDCIGASGAAKDKCIDELSNLCNSINYNLTKSQLLAIIDCTGDYIIYRKYIMSNTIFEELTDILHRYMVSQMRINSICDGNLYFNRNTTNGRLDSNLTTLPSYLRKFIVSEEELYNVDIKNSQPYFFYTKLINEPSVDKAELARYGKWVTDGVLYEKLAEEWYKIYRKEKTRKQMKQMMMVI